MTQLSNRLLLNKCIYYLLRDSRRFAGHNKWSNIKHIKAEHDHEKMVQFHHFKLQMLSAIRENGTAKPNNNQKLAKIIEQAKKSNMSIASIQSFLEKMEGRKTKTQKGMLEVRGPGGYVMLISYLTDNPKQLIIDLNSRLKKTSGKVTDSSGVKIFTHTGNIIVEKKGHLDQATDDAINVGAEDVEEFRENDTEYFHFKCDPKLLNKIKNLLEDRQYCVLSAEDHYIPNIVIKLNESDMAAISDIHKRLSNLEDISHIYDNLA